MTIKTLNDLFRRTLQDVLYAEHQTLKALPALARRATLSDLKTAMTQQKAETEKRIHRLEAAFQALKMKPTPHDSAAIDGILKEADTLAHEITDTDTRDAALLAAMQEVEHYGITRYGTLHAWATQLGLKDVTTSLKDNLLASKEVDRAFSTMAQASVNRLAAA